MCICFDLVSAPVVSLICYLPVCSSVFNSKSLKLYLCVFKPFMSDIFWFWPLVVFCILSCLCKNWHPTKLPTTPRASQTCLPRTLTDISLCLFSVPEDPPFFPVLSQEKSSTPLLVDRELFKTMIGWPCGHDWSKRLQRGRSLCSFPVVTEPFNFFCLSGFLRFDSDFFSHVVCTSPDRYLTIAWLLPVFNLVSS